MVLTLRRALSIIALCCTVVAHANHSAAEDKKLVRQGLGWFAAPILNYDSDTGLGYGGRLMLFDYGDDLKPYRYAMRLQLFRTTSGIEAHRVFFDAPWIRGSPWRIDASLHYTADPNSPWYGLGAGSERHPEYTECDDRAALAQDPDTCPDNPLFRGLYYYRYRAVHPHGLINVRRALLGPWQAMAGYSLRFSAFRTHYPDDLGQTGDSRLLEDLAAGEPIIGLVLNADGSVQDSRIAELQTGLVYDTRDIEAAPTRGSWHEFSAFAASPVIGSRFWYWGINLTLRGYWSLVPGDRLVVAARFIFDALGGDVPFDRLGGTGGLSPSRHLGGASSIRGLPRERYVGKVKMLANSELRWRGYSLWLGKHRIDLGGVVGLDIGRVWRDLAADGRFFAIPVSVVAGFRGVYDESVVMSLDYGRSFDEDTSGVYLNFNHIF